MKEEKIVDAGCDKQAEVTPSRMIRQIGLAGIAIDSPEVVCTAFDCIFSNGTGKCRATGIALINGDCHTYTPPEEEEEE